MIVAATIGATTACDATLTRSVPDCTSWERLGAIAQSVPTSSYVPCISTLPLGWRSEKLTVTSGGTAFDMVSDRAGGRAVDVTLRRFCGTLGATPIPPRTTGGRTLLRLSSISPRYAGTMFDVFPGGCVTYRFDFPRGPHIGLMDDLQTAVGFVPRSALRLQLRRTLHVDLG